MARYQRALRRRRQPRAKGIVVLVAALVVAGFVAVPLWADLTPDPGSSPTAAPTASTAPDPDAAAETAAAMDSLAALETVDGQSIARYYRESSFGQAWEDQDRNGCDTRNDILGRDLDDPAYKADTGGCKVLEGTLEDPYTGEVVQFVSGPDTSVLVQIDHMVALSWAWRHGAEFWSEEQRTAFANDPANLRATVGSVNQSKSDSGPSEWMPPAEALRCDYARDVVAVLAEWELGIGDADRRALEGVLVGCR